MSTTKFLIHKTENGNNFQFLHITIPEESSASEIKFSEWVSSPPPPKRKPSEKSSRLVVKIVSGEERKKIDLDSCAERICDTDAPCAPPGDADEHLANPLDNSLQKVKENNARIMENINMLNRTLSYTRNNEMLDILCPKPIHTYPCKSCGKCFVYETGLRRHLRARHAADAGQPRWQLVWTCVQCFQVWPTEDSALHHSARCANDFPANQECIREIKTSLLLQCEFCERVFTSIPRLLRHCKMHNTWKNYQCNSCSIAFISYKMFEQHWLSCPFLNSSYCFSLPKMLLCNICDRKFRNYEHLYNHRYKMDHFMKKTYRSGQAMEMLVYQCELCSQWFTSTVHIKEHRSQHHSSQDIGIPLYCDSRASMDGVDSYSNIVDTMGNM